MNIDMDTQYDPAFAIDGAKIVNVIAEVLDKSGFLAFFISSRIDEWLDEEELEYRGRWCDDGGRVIDEDVL